MKVGSYSCKIRQDKLPVAHSAKLSRYERAG